MLIKYVNQKYAFGLNKTHFVKYKSRFVELTIHIFTYGVAMPWIVQANCQLITFDNVI